MAPKDNPSSPKADDLFFGKYRNREEAEKGFSHLVGFADQIKQENANLKQQLASLNATVAALGQARGAPAPAAAPPALTDEEGRLDPGALMATIEAQMAPIRDALGKIPDLVNESVAGILRPISSAATARKAFFERPDVDEGFNDSTLAATLKGNQGISKAYEALMTNPDTQADAHMMVYDVWKSTRSKSAVPQREKREASEPIAQGGPPVEGPAQSQAAEEMAKLAAVAQDNLAPDSQIAFAREWIKGSKVEKKIGTMPEDWDLETPDSDSLVQ